MTLKIRVVRKIIKTLNEKYPYLMRDIVVGEKFHIHRNPRKRLNVVGGETIEDGFGSSWSAYCPECGGKTMQVVRPGKVQCGKCG